MVRCLTASRSKSTGLSVLRERNMNRAASAPTSLTTSARVSKVPARVDMLTGWPLMSRFTSWMSTTSKFFFPFPMASMAARMRGT